MHEHRELGKTRPGEAALDIRMQRTSVPMMRIFFEGSSSKRCFALNKIFRGTLNGEDCERECVKLKLTSFRWNCVHGSKNL